MSQRVDDSRLVDAALKYAERGQRVLPLHNIVDDGGNLVCSCRDGANCKHPGKHPRTRQGLHDATTDIKTIKQWWAHWPSANIGLRPNNNEIVVDVDPRNAGGPDKAFQNLGEVTDGQVATRSSITGSGGAHLWLKIPNGFSAKCSANKIAPGIDIKTSDGFVVAPPSRHVSGGYYQWEGSASVSNVAIADAPICLLQRIERAHSDRSRAMGSSLCATIRPPLRRGRSCCSPAFTATASRRNSAGLSACRSGPLLCGRPSSNPESRIQFQATSR